MKLLGKLTAFRDNGEGDECADQDMVVELADFTKSGDIEVAFNTQLPPGRTRIYPRVNLPHLISMAMKEHGMEEDV